MATKSKNKRISDIGLKFFEPDFKTAELLKTFNSIYTNKKGNWPGIKKELTKNKGFTPELIRKLDFTHSLSVWSNDNENLVSLFQKDKDTNSMRDIALKYNKVAFIKKTKKVATRGTEKEKEVFSLHQYNDLFHTEPTAMLINMIKDPQVPLLNNFIGENVVKVLEKQLDFNIKTTSIYDLLKRKDVLKDVPSDMQHDTIMHLKILQRITAVSPVADAIPVLYNSNLHSAFQISEIPCKQFKVLLKNKGLDETILNHLYENAQQALECDHCLCSDTKK